MDKKLTWVLGGCGCGCAVLIVIFVILGIGGFKFLQDTIGGFDSAVELRTTLEEQFGTTSEFVPSVAGNVAADRMEAFLAVRDVTQPLRAEIARTLEGFAAAESRSDKSTTGSLRDVLTIGRSAMGLGETLGRFFETRNRALLEEQMGLGEYTYIYSLVYYSWLGHAPQDGAGDGHRALDGRIRRDLLAMLQNQLGAVADGPWQRQLTDEIDALERDRSRLPWQGGLPDDIRNSFEPYRERLEASYSPTTNEFELARNQRRGNWSIQAD